MHRRELKDQSTVSYQLLLLLLLLLPLPLLLHALSQLPDSLLPATTVTTATTTCTCEQYICLQTASLDVIPPLLQERLRLKGDRQLTLPQ